MEIHLSAEQEAHLALLASSNGRRADELARDAILRFLDEERRFAEAVKIGIQAADLSEVVAAETAWDSVERILQS